MLYDTPYPSANPNGRGLSSPQAEPSLAAMAQVEDLAVPQLQETLAENLGLYVEIDFLTGAGNLATRDGILYAVGADYVTLYQEADDRYILCAMDSIQFITFYNSRIAPADRGTNDTTGSGSIPLGRNRNVG